MDISIFSRGINVGKTPKVEKIKEIAPPTEVTILLNDKSDFDFKITVEKDQSVCAGDVIATDKQKNGFNKHTPISGKVKAISKVLIPAGHMVDAVVIQAENADGNPCEKVEPTKPASDELLQQICKAGIEKPGPYGKPLFQLITESFRPRGKNSWGSKPVTRPITDIIVRCCDIDPSCVTQFHITALLSDSSDLATGIEILKNVTHAKRIHVVLDKKQKAPSIEKLAEQNDFPIIKVAATRYPFAEDPFLVKQATGQEPPLGFNQLHESGALVLDIETVLEVARATTNNCPSSQKIFTVCTTDGPIICKATIGTSIKDIATELNLDTDVGQIVIGGLLSGQAHQSYDYPVTSDLNGVGFIPKAHISNFANEPCINCGLCSSVCPTRINPGMLSKYCEFDQFESAEAAHIFNCIECGCCSYVCPAERSLVQFLAHGKNELMSQRRDK